MTKDKVHISKLLPPLPPFPPFLSPEWFVDSNAKLEKKKVYMYNGWKRD